jgi:hypothetical protein
MLIKKLAVQCSESSIQRSLSHTLSYKAPPPLSFSNTQGAGLLLSLHSFFFSLFPPRHAVTPNPTHAPLFVPAFLCIIPQCRPCIAHVPRRKHFFPAEVWQDRGAGAAEVRNFLAHAFFGGACTRTRTPSFRPSLSMVNTQHETRNDTRPPPSPSACFPAVMTYCCDHRAIELS